MQQRILGCGDGYWGDCFKCSVASVLERPYEEVPNFVDEEAYGNQNRPEDERPMKDSEEFQAYWEMFSHPEDVAKAPYSYAQLETALVDTLNVFTLLNQSAASEEARFMMSELMRFKVETQDPQIAANLLWGAMQIKEASFTLGEVPDYPPES